MAHPNEDKVRAAYALFAQGDPNGYLSYCSNDITFRVPGKSQIAGTYSRTEFLSTLLGKVMQLTGGSFRETIIDVLANDNCGVVLASHEFKRGAKRCKYDTVHVYEIRGGKLASFAEYPADQYAFDEAWG